MAETAEDSGSSEGTSEPSSSKPTRVTALLSLIRDIQGSSSFVSNVDRALWTSAPKEAASQRKFRDLEQENIRLKKEIDQYLSELGTKDGENSTLRKTVEDLKNNEYLKLLANRVNQTAQEVLLEKSSLGNALYEQFRQKGQHKIFVMSVDIRRSTELMLKARKPECFAAFIIELCQDIKNKITDFYGVFDKFTGDGILAFFPPFFSGPDAGILAVKAAMQCHESFRRLYKSRRKSFSSILTDVGLGIGIDYGDALLLQFEEALTVIGAPVVYACRLSSAPVGRTYLNQPAYEKIHERSHMAFHFSEEELCIKHEGSILAYSVQETGVEIKVVPPSWIPVKAQTSLNSPWSLSMNLDS
ncbi:MAG: adenylate/guanylate cyclase domain-containing protein [Candidatus Tectimicrobiota bacterium]